MTAVALAGGARTPICRAGGALRDVEVISLAAVAARSALDDARTAPGDVGAIVASCALPTDTRDVDLGASVAGELAADGVLTLTAGGLVTAGLTALVAAVALCERERRPVLVVGADSASRVPYWAQVPRHASGRGDAGVLDPLGAAIAAAAPPPDCGKREQQDAFALRSHTLARSRPAERIVAVGGTAHDEPASPGISEDDLAALKPVFTPEGTATTGNTALPADGAAALVLVPGGAGPRFAGAGGRVMTFEILETSAAAVLVDRRASGDDVNPAGGAIGQGLPLSCGGLVMALRLAARLAPGQTGELRAGPVGLELSA